MLYRIVLILVTAFWVTMNVLLWRSEFGSRRTGGSPVPVEVVWKKILTAPDISSLSIVHRGQRIGFCDWRTGIGAEWATVSEDNLPPALSGKTASYRLWLQGTAMMPALTNHLRFDGSLRISTNQTWQQLDVRLSWRGRAAVWQIHASAVEQTVRLQVDSEAGRFERVFTFTELQNPTALVQEMIGPLANDLVSGVPWPAPVPAPGPAPELGVKWEASEDTMRIGHAPVRVYRVQTRLLDRYEIVLVVSRVGEILRVELPDQFVLVNDQLTTL